MQINSERVGGNMDILALIAAFGGGIIGAYMGALPAFIMTGLFALVGAVATAAGAPADIAVSYLAFGSFVGPHIAFAGGAAAAAYAGRKGSLKSGADILSALYGLKEADVLLVGGVFGVLGFIVHYVISITPLGPMTDLPGITVFILAVVTRLLFGKTGLTGKYTGKEKREWISGGKGLNNNIVWGMGIGIAVSFVAAVLSSLDNWDTVSGIYPIIVFGFSAITLIFTQTGFAVPSTHHVTLPSALAAVVGITAFGPYGAFLGVLFGILGALLGNFVECTFNSHCDTHIDPPATTIFILTIIVSLIKMAIV